MKFFVYGITIISLIFLISVFVLNISDSYLLSLCLGWFIAFFYIVTGFILFLKALKIKNKTFGKMVTLSVFGRIVFVLAGIALSIKFLDVHNTAFVATLFTFYFIFQIMEVVGLNKISLKGA